MLLPPWLATSLARPNLDDAAVGAAADWLRPLWRAPPGGARGRRALAVARSPAEAAAAVAQLPFPCRAVLSALAAEPNVSAHATTLAGILFAREGAEGTGIDAWERREGEQEKDVLEAVVRGRASLLIVFENRVVIFGTSPVTDEARPSTVSAEFASDRAALKVRVEALEVELAASQRKTLRVEARFSEMDQNFEFWTRLLLAEVKTTSAIDTAGRAALADAIKCLSKRPTSVLDASKGHGVNAVDGAGLCHGKPNMTWVSGENSSKSCQSGSSMSLSNIGKSFGRRESSARVETECESEDARRSEESIDDRAAQLLGIKGNFYCPSNSTENQMLESASTEANEHHVFRDGQWRTIALPEPTARPRSFALSRMNAAVTPRPAGGA